MQGVAVLTAVPAEPRKMFPLEVFRKVMLSLDPGSFRDANLGLVLLSLLFTFSRTECPCPKTFDGFDLGKHWAVADFRLVSQRGHWVLWIRFKAIKQDPRKERPTLGGTAALPFEDNSSGQGHDWVPVGDVPDLPEFSIARWYMAYVRAIGRERKADEPMFLSQDERRCYTYSCLRADLFRVLSGLGLDTSHTPHGIRVLGYNLSKRGNGVEITVAHGGWMSEGHDRYERFSNLQLFGIPAGMLQVVNPFGSEPRPISRVRSSRHGEPTVSDRDSSGDEGGAESGPQAAQPAPLPDGYVEHLHTTPAGRVYPTYVGASGRVARSRVEAWRQVAELEEGDTANFDADAAGSSDLSYEPYAVFDLASPEVQGPGTPLVRRERLSDLAQRLRSARISPAAEPTRQLPFGASCVEVEVSVEQCGNPHCTVVSRNGLHAGPHVFRDPPPRR